MEAEEDRYSDNYALYRTFEEMDEEVLLVHQLCTKALGTSHSSKKLNF
jgi:hypothetical protein